ncbi:hypothetical protein MRX96_013300 [Rhipicephalus microplus]
MRDSSKVSASLCKKQNLCSLSSCVILIFHLKFPEIEQQLELCIVVWQSQGLEVKLTPRRPANPLEHTQ